jgi:hypothetical protein
VVLYMHIESRDRVEPGTFLRAGERVGHPSCEAASPMAPTCTWPGASMASGSPPTAGPRSTSTAGSPRAQASSTMVT